MYCNIVLRAFTYSLRVNESGEFTIQTLPTRLPCSCIVKNVHNNNTLQSCVVLNEHWNEMDAHFPANCWLYRISYTNYRMDMFAHVVLNMLCEYCWSVYGRKCEHIKFTLLKFKTSGVNHSIYLNYCFWRNLIFN